MYLYSWFIRVHIIRCVCVGVCVCTCVCKKRIVYFFLNYLFIYFYLWLCWVLVSVRGLSPVAASGDHSSSQCAGPSLSRPLLLRSTGSRHAGSAVVAHGPSCSAACGILPDQGSNPRPLHWQADSQPLRHQGSPRIVYFKVFQVSRKGTMASLPPPPHPHYWGLITSIYGEVRWQQHWWPTSEISDKEQLLLSCFSFKSWCLLLLGLETLWY